MAPARHLFLRKMSPCASVHDLPHLAHPPAWIENDLPYEEAQLLNTHVADCDECRGKLALIRVSAP